MDKQPSVKAYHQQAPAMPQGTVPVAGVESAEEPNLEQGQAYYANYCAFCHGDQGRGDGPVATVLTPETPDLTSSAVKNLSDAELHDRMLHGVGHDPTMEQTVPPERRRQIVMYVRSLQRESVPATPSRMDQPASGPAPVRP